MLIGPNFQDHVNDEDVKYFLSSVGWPKSSVKEKEDFFSVKFFFHGKIRALRFFPKEESFTLEDKRGGKWLNSDKSLNSFWVSFLLGKNPRGPYFEKVVTQKGLLAVHHWSIEGALPYPPPEGAFNPRLLSLSQAKEAIRLANFPVLQGRLVGRDERFIYQNAPFAAILYDIDGTIVTDQHGHKYILGLPSSDYE